MYNHHFGLAEAPFSIAPDPRYLYLSEQHREALAHLLYGIGDHGGFVVLTGEVGTGKTTVCRCLLQQIPDHIDIAVIVNPKLSSQELLQTICDELGVALAEEQPTAKQLIDALNTFLLATHARGRNAILIIDEAQNIAIDVLEQLRLLTNLETNERKLLQLILLGQPELNTLLAQPSLRQLAQRITARYHLRPLARQEIAQYIEHRLAIAGCRGHLFTAAAIARIYRYSKGIPRLINLLGDRALLGVYAENGAVVDVAMVRRAAHEVLPKQAGWRTPKLLYPALAATLAILLIVAALYWWPARQDSVVVNGAASAPQNWHAALPGVVADEAAALRSLYQLWGQSPPPEAINCAAAVVGNLRCVHLSGATAAVLQRYDTPVALRLQRTPTAAAQFVVLKQLQQAQARIEFDRREWNVPWSELEKLWQGELLLLTPAPIGLLPLQLGATDPLVGWLDEQLYRHFHRNQPRWQREVYDRSTELADSIPKQAWLVSHYLALREQPAATTYNGELLEQVKRFQQQQGLRDDGVVDIDTVLALTRSVAANQPHISQPRNGQSQISQPAVGATNTQRGG
jgi:general secretion pathway protein A